MRSVRLVCAVYCLFVTLLLVAPDPLTLLGIERLPTPEGGRGVHFVVFALLAFVVHASRFPVHRGLTSALLVAYAILTELLQGFVPSRSVEFLDLLENLLGLGTGTAIWLLVQKTHVKRPEISTDESEPSVLSSDQQQGLSSADASVVESRSTTG